MVKGHWGPTTSWLSYFEAVKLILPMLTVNLRERNLAYVGPKKS